MTCMCAQSCLTLCDPIWHCSLPGSSVQARILGWLAISSSRGSSQPRDWILRMAHLLHWQADSLPLYHLPWMHRHKRADLTGMERGENMKTIFVWIYTLAPLSSAEWETWLNAVDDYDAGFHRKEVGGDLKKNTRRHHQGLLESGAHSQCPSVSLVF